MLKINSSILLEVVVGSGSTAKLGNDDFFKDKVICGAEIFTADQMTKAPSGNTVLSSANMKKAYLTFENTKGIQIIKDYPCNAMVTANNGGYVKEFEPFKINQAKSEIKFSDTTGLTAGEVILLQIHYK